MQNIHFRCRNCKTKYNARPEQAGKSAVCRVCGKEIIVPKMEKEQLVAHGGGRTKSTKVVTAARIMLSYRRDDVPHAVDRIAERLQDRLGRKSVFLDIDSIEAGEDWRRRLAQTLAQCVALLVVIGPKWLRKVKDHELTALDDPKDLVRMEIKTALARRITVIPVLIDGAELPVASELPKELRRLTNYHALSIRRDRFDSDAEILLQRVESQVDLTASFGRRATAFAIDSLVPLGVLFFISQLEVVGFLAVYVLYHWLLVGTTGRTLGKLLMGIRVEFSDESAVRWVYAFFRPTVGYVLSIISMIGLVQFMLHKKHSTFHDLLSRTKVLRVHHKISWRMPRSLDEFSNAVDEHIQKGLGSLGPLGRLLYYLVTFYFGVSSILKVVTGIVGWTTKALKLSTTTTADASGTAATGTGATLTAQSGAATAGSVLVTTSSQIIVGLALAIGAVTAYEQIAPRQLRIVNRIPAAKIPGTDVKVVGKNVLVLSDTSGSMSDNRETRDQMIQILRDRGLKVHIHGVSTGGVSASSPEIVTALKTAFKIGIDTVYLFSDFQESSDAQGVQQLREFLEEKGLRLYVGTVEKSPGSELIKLAEETGGKFVKQTADALIQ